MIIYEMAQHSPEWHAVRCGKITASKFDLLMVQPRSGLWNKTQSDYLYQVAAERLTGVSKESFRANATVQRGRDLEEAARATYEIMTGQKVRQVGFVEYNDFIGCSPDGLIDPAGGWEAKCPDSDTQLRRSRDLQSFVDELWWQVQGGLFCCEDRNYWVLASYDDRFQDENLQLITAHVGRNQEAQAALKARLDQAVAFIRDLTGE